MNEHENEKAQMKNETCPYGQVDRESAQVQHIREQKACEAVHTDYLCLYTSQERESRRTSQRQQDQKSAFHTEHNESKKRAKAELVDKRVE